MDRLRQYAADSSLSGDAARDITRNVTSTLRSHIRSLEIKQLLTPEWYRQADVLEHLASVAVMERRKFPAGPDQPAAKLSPKRVGEDATLWEREELCIRFLLEEGKINMLLRSLHEYRQVMHAIQVQTEYREKFFKFVQLNTEKEQSTAIAKMRQFEQSVGTLLFVAFQSIEALQTLDMVELMQHCALVLTFAIEYIGKDLVVSSDSEQLQEHFVAKYLVTIMKKIEELNEQIIMEQIEKTCLIPLLLKFVQQYFEFLGDDSKISYLQSLSAIMDSELFKTRRSRFFVSDANSMKLLLGLKDGILKSFATNADRRKIVRAISDTILYFEMTNE